MDATLLLGLGVFLVLYGTAVGLAASRPLPSATAVKVIVDANALWAVLSVVALAAWLEPTTAGTVWIPAQAVTVAAFAALQWSALRADRR